MTFTDGLNTFLMYCSLLVLKRERRMEILAIISPPPFFQFHRCFGLRVSTLRLLKNTLCHLVIIVIHKVFEFHLFPPGLLSVWFTFLFIFCFFFYVILPNSAYHPTSFHTKASTLLDLNDLNLLSMLQSSLGYWPCCVCLVGYPVFFRIK